MRGVAPQAGVAARQHHTALASQHTAMRLGGLGGMPAAAPGAPPHPHRWDPSREGV